MKWYDLLISDEFIDYFCNNGPENSCKKWDDTVTGITYYFADLVQNESIREIIKLSPDTYNAFLYCEKCKPEKNLLTDCYKSLRQKGYDNYSSSPQVCSADELGALIIYPFFSRMDGPFGDDFIKDDKMEKYLLALKSKTQKQKAL